MQGGAAPWESRASEIGAALKRAQRRAELEAGVAERRLRHSGTAVGWEAAGRLEQARTRAALLREAWLASQAAALAAALEPGVPCPVCGSTSHPLPAHEGVVEGGAKAPSQKDHETRIRQ